MSLAASTPPPNRAVVFLVETSNMKKPAPADLGEDVNVRRAGLTCDCVYDVML
jgi:hypothetical protein